VHKPRTQVAPVPQVVPSGSWTAVHTGIDPWQSTLPRKHGIDWHGAPFWHAPQVPCSQIIPAPQGVPSLPGCPVSSQTDVAEQVLIPA
jgi:hypothetical protein